MKQYAELEPTSHSTLQTLYPARRPLVTAARLAYLDPRSQRPHSAHQARSALPVTPRSLPHSPASVYAHHYPATQVPSSSSQPDPPSAAAPPTTGAPLSRPPRASPDAPAARDTTTGYRRASRTDPCRRSRTRAAAAAQTWMCWLWMWRRGCSAGGSREASCSCRAAGRSSGARRRGRLSEGPGRGVGAGLGGRLEGRRRRGSEGRTVVVHCGRFGGDDCSM
jgi:hypothetical protein